MFNFDNDLLIILAIAVIIFLILNCSAKKSAPVATTTESVPVEQFEETEELLEPSQNDIAEQVEQQMTAPATPVVSAPAAATQPSTFDDFYNDDLKGGDREYDVQFNSNNTLAADYNQGYTLGVNMNDPEFKSLNNVPNDNQMISDDLLPKKSEDWFETPSVGVEIEDANLLADALFRSGVNTVGSTRKNANYDIRGNIPNPKIVVSPWNNSSYDPDNNLDGLCA